MAASCCLAFVNGLRALLDRLAEYLEKRCQSSPHYERFENAETEIHHLPVLVPYQDGRCETEEPRSDAIQRVPIIVSSACPTTSGQKQEESNLIKLPKKRSCTERISVSETIYVNSGLPLNQFLGRGVRETKPGSRETIKPAEPVIGETIQTNSEPVVEEPYITHTVAGDRIAALKKQLFEQSLQEKQQKQTKPAAKAGKTPIPLTRSTSEGKIATKRRSIAKVLEKKFDLAPTLFPLFPKPKTTKNYVSSGKMSLERSYSTGIFEINRKYFN